MKLLSISGILPIPDLIKENDIIFQIYDHYCKVYPQTEVQFIRTIVYSNYLLAKIKDKWNRYYQAIQRGQYIDRGYKVTVFPHFVFQSKENLFTLLSKAVYYQNRNKIQDLESFDLIHAQRIFPEGYLARKISEKYSIPYILTVRKESNYFNGSSSEKRARSILQQASHITTLTKKSYSFFNNRYPHKTSLIPHGIEKCFFSSKPKKKDDTVRILTVAQLLEYKRIEPVIEALSNLKDNYKFEYTIVGDGPLRTSIRQNIQEHHMQNHVKMIPRVPHESIPEIYTESDLFILTSYPETFGRVYFEAMASGIPIICSEDSGVDGLFKDRKSGFSVDHRNPEELVKVLEELIQSRTLREEVGKAGQRVVAQYSWPNIVQKYNAVYQSAVNSSNPFAQTEIAKE